MHPVQDDRRRRFITREKKSVYLLTLLPLRSAFKAYCTGAEQERERTTKVGKTPEAVHETAGTVRSWF